MTTYSQAVANLTKNGPKRFTYLCGDQSVLVEKLLDLLRASVGASPTDSFSWSADEDDPAEIWSSMNQLAMVPEKPKFVLIREAQKFTGWEQFDGWLKARSMTPVKVVAVAAEPEWPKKRWPDVRERIMKSSQVLYVEASLPKTDPEKMAVDLLGQWGGLGKETATHLLRRTGYDLARCRDVCTWVKHLPGQITSAVIDVLAQPAPQDSYVEALVRIDKGKAAEMARGVSLDAHGRIIGSLVIQLGDLERLHDAQATLSLKGVPTKTELAKAADLPMIKALTLGPSAKHYDSASVRRRTEVLAQADESRGQVGVLERVAALW